MSVENEMNLSDIINEHDIEKKLNSLAIVAYKNHEGIKKCREEFGKTYKSLPCVTEGKCNTGYGRRDKLINWAGIGTAIGAGVGAFIYALFNRNSG